MSSTQAIIDQLEEAIRQSPALSKWYNGNKILNHHLARMLDLHVYVALFTYLKQVPGGGYLSAWRGLKREGVDGPSWLRFMRVGEKYARYLCEGKIEVPDNKDAVIKIKDYIIKFREQKRDFEFSVKPYRGKLEDKTYVSDGHILIPCASEGGDMSLYFGISGMIAGKLEIENRVPVSIAEVPNFENWEWTRLPSLTLSNGAEISPVKLAAAISAVGSPFQLYGEKVRKIRGPKGEMVTEDLLGSTIVVGPNGSASVMPLRPTSPAYLQNKIDDVRAEYAVDKRLIKKKKRGSRR